MNWDVLMAQMGSRAGASVGFVALWFEMSRLTRMCSQHARRWMEQQLAFKRCVPAASAWVRPVVRFKKGRAFTTLYGHPLQLMVLLELLHQRAYTNQTQSAEDAAKERSMRQQVQQQVVWPWFLSCHQKEPAGFGLLWLLRLFCSSCPPIPGASPT